MISLRLSHLPPWLAYLPGLVVACAFVLVSFVLVAGWRYGPSEDAFAEQGMLQKGDSLILALQGGMIKTGLWQRLDGGEIRDVLDAVGTQFGARSIALTDGSGRVVAAGRSAEAHRDWLTPQRLATLRPSPSAQWIEVVENGHSWFVVYKKLGESLPEMDSHRLARARERGGLPGELSGTRDRPMLRPVPTPEEPLLAFVTYDAAPLEAARLGKERRQAILAAVLIILGLVGILTIRLIRAYRCSRAIIQASTAFSAEIVATLPVGLIVTDSKGLVSTFNPEAERITGLRQEEVLARALKDVLPSGSPLLECYERIRNTTGRRREQEIRCDFGNGRRVPLALSASSIAAKDECLVRHVLILRDLGELRQLQAELRRRERLAALGSLAAGVAHEIRNPLGAIKGLARFFQEVSPPESEESKVALIMTREVTRLDKVVGDLLDCARPAVPRFAPTALDALLERALRLAGPDLEGRDVACSLSLPDPVPTVLLDADRVTQVLLNLFLNAVQAMQDSDRPRNLELEAVLESDGSLRLDIRDNGCGMTPEQLERLFSPYNTTKPGGTGLGLFIAHKIVEAHGGDIEVASKSGEGTTVTLRFPAHPDQEFRKTGRETGSEFGQEARHD